MKNSSLFTTLDTIILYVTDIERAKDFYSNLLKLTIEFDDKIFVSFKINKDEKTKIALNAEHKGGQYPGHQTKIMVTLYISIIIL